MTPANEKLENELQKIRAGMADLICVATIRTRDKIDLLSNLDVRVAKQHEVC